MWKGIHYRNKGEGMADSRKKLIEELNSLGKLLMETKLSRVMGSQSKEKYSAKKTRKEIARIYGKLNQRKDSPADE